MMDAERVHNHALIAGGILGSNVLFRKITSIFFNFSSLMLKQNICGITFKNPIGLAAGFDKDAKIIDIMPSLSFGFTEVGSITGQPCAGNPKPRLWRLVKSKGIVVNYGLNNQGAEKIAQRLTKKNLLAEIPIGINIAKTNSLETDEINKGIDDYLKGIQFFLDIGDYLTINISCPNTYGGQPFIDPNYLSQLFEKVDELNIKKPIFLKMPPDISLDRVDKIIDLVERYNFAGFICSNLTKDRTNLKAIKGEINQVPNIGGVSGKPTEELANQQIRYIYEKTQGQKIIIGCGGIFNAEDAYRKIKLGASLLQLITGMIFKGPQVISQINLGLCDLLKKDGFKNIKEAVGSDFK